MRAFSLDLAACKNEKKKIKKEQKPKQKCQNRIFKEIPWEVTGCGFQSGPVHFVLPEPVSDSSKLPVFNSTAASSKSGSKHVH